MTGGKALRVCVCVCACVCERAYVCLYVHVCGTVCTCTCVWVRAIYSCRLGYNVMLSVCLAFCSSDSLHNPHHLALAVYRFPPNVVPKPQKHGNAIEDKPFFPTWASTKQLVKTECQSSGPKQAVHRVSDKVGGLMASSCSGQLPRNERQAKYVKSSSKATEYDPADERYAVMFKAKQDDAQSLLRRELQSMIAFGTDGEEALANAFGHEFQSAVRLTCAIHKRRNVEAKLKALEVSTEVQGKILTTYLVTWRHVLRRLGRCC